MLGDFRRLLDELERDDRLSFTLDGQVSLVDDYLELRYQIPLSLLPE